MPYNPLPLAQFINMRALADQTAMESNQLQMQGALSRPPYIEGLDPRAVSANQDKKLIAWSMRQPTKGMGAIPSPGYFPAVDPAVADPTYAGAALAEGINPASGWPPLQNMGALSQQNFAQVEPPDQGVGGGAQVQQPPQPPQQPQAQPPQMGIRPQSDPGFGDRANAAPQQQNSMVPSDAGMWGLIAAGLGILANNYGNYGQASPAIGKGGLIGVNTYLNQRQQGIENKRRDELAAADSEWRRSQANYNERSLGLQERRVDMEERAKQAAAQQAETRAALAVALAGADPVQQKIAALDPDEYLKFRVGQLKPDYKEREVKDGMKAYTEYSTEGGREGSWKKVPGSGTYDLRAAKGGSDIKISQEAKTTESFNDMSAKEQAKSLLDEYNMLRTIPSQFIAMDEAEKALKAAGGFVGSGAETKLALAKFFNNNFGTDIGAKEVENAEVMRSAIFRQIMENLKKLDSQPSQQQQKVMQESLGSIGTDPAAIPRILKITRDALTSRAKEHNRRVRQAKENKATFIYDITIPGFDDPAEPPPWKQ